MLVLRQHLVWPAADAPLPPPLLRLRCLRRLRCRRPRRAVRQYCLGRTATATAAAAWRGNAASVVHDMVHVVAHRAHHEHQGEVQNAPRGGPHMGRSLEETSHSSNPISPAVGVEFERGEQGGEVALTRRTLPTRRPALPPLLCSGVHAAQLATSIPKPWPCSMYTRGRKVR